MGQALYRKWRPQTFDDVVGQEYIVKTLRYALRTGHIHHAYLLAGPRGTGKTTTARLIAKAVNCLAPKAERPCNHCEICNAVNEGRLMDLVEIDAASNTGVDNIRDLLEKVGFHPTQARYKVYVVDEVHMLSTAAFNALLKTLEEPPEHVIFVLATTEVHKIPETILSRCQRYEFRRIPLDIIIARLETIAAAEGITVEREALDLIGRAATGSMRDAISLFDQLAATGSITAEYVRLILGAERREVVKALLQAWVEHDIATGLKIINQAIDNGADPRQLARQTADFLRGLLLIRLGAGHMWADPTPEERESLSAIAQKVDPNSLIAAVQRFSKAATEQRTGWQPQLPLELAFVEATLKAQTTSRRETQKPSLTNETATSPGAHNAPAARRGVDTTTKPLQPTGDAARDITPERSKATQAPKTHSADEKASSPPTPQSGSSHLDPGAVEDLKNNWQDFVRRLRPVALGALLRDAGIGGVDSNGRLVLAFQHAFHRDKISETDNLRQVEEILSHSLGRPVMIRCLLATEWSAQETTLSGPTPHGAAPALPPEEDELIRRAQEELGAVARING